MSLEKGVSSGDNTLSLHLAWKQKFYYPEIYSRSKE
jgi:hypothetical protein